MQSVIAADIVLLLLIISSCGLALLSAAKGFIPIISFVSFFLITGALLVAAGRGASLDEIFVCLLIYFATCLAPYRRKGNEL